MASKGAEEVRVIDRQTCSISLGGIEFAISGVSYGESAKRRMVDRVSGHYAGNFEFTVRLDLIDLWGFIHGGDSQIERWEGEGGAVQCEC